MRRTSALAFREGLGSAAPGDKIIELPRTNWARAMERSACHVDGPGATGKVTDEPRILDDAVRREIDELDNQGSPGKATKKVLLFLLERIEGYLKGLPEVIRRKVEETVLKSEFFNRLADVVIERLLADPQKTGAFINRILERLDEEYDLEKRFAEINAKLDAIADLLGADMEVEQTKEGAPVVSISRRVNIDEGEEPGLLGQVDGLEEKMRRSSTDIVAVKRILEGTPAEGSKPATLGLRALVYGTAAQGSRPAIPGLRDYVEQLRAEVYGTVQGQQTTPGILGRLEELRTIVLGRPAQTGQPQVTGLGNVVKSLKRRGKL